MTQRVITGSQWWQDLGREPWNPDAGDLDGGLDGALSDSGEAEIGRRPERENDNEDRDIM